MNSPEMNSYPDTFKQVPRYGYPYPEKGRLLVIELRSDKTFRFANYAGQTHFDLWLEPSEFEVKRGKRVMTRLGRTHAWAGDIVRWRYATEEEPLKIMAMQSRGSATLAFFEPLA